MADGVKTYGEFIAAMEETACIYARVFLEEWKALATEEQWAEYRPMPLGRGLILNFAEDMTFYFQEMISGTCTDELYVERVKACHAFQRWIWEQAAALGIEVKLEEIDSAVTPTEAIIASGFAKVVPADG